MTKIVPCLLGLLLLGIPSATHADDACNLERAYRDQLEAMHSEYAQEASRVETLDATIAQLRAQFPDTREASDRRADLRERINGYLTERRATFTNLRLRRDAMQQTSEKIAEAQRACIRSKGGSESAPRTPVQTQVDK